METLRNNSLAELELKLKNLEESDTSKSYDFGKFKEGYSIRLKIGEINGEPKKGVIKDEITRIASLEEKDRKGWDKELSDQRVYLAVEKGELEKSDYIRYDFKSPTIINNAFRIEANRLDELEKGFKTNHVIFKAKDGFKYHDNAGEIKKVTKEYRKIGLEALAYSNHGGVPTAFRQRNKLPI